MQQTLLLPTARGEGLSLPQNTSLNNMAAKGMYTHWLIPIVHVPVLQTLTPSLNILHFPPQSLRCTTCPMCLVGAGRGWPSPSGNPSSEVVYTMLMLMVWWCGVAALISLLLLNSITLCTQAWKRSQNMEFKAQKKKPCDLWTLETTVESENKQFKVSVYQWALYADIKIVPVHAWYTLHRAVLLPRRDFCSLQDTWPCWQVWVL